ncbi:MAG: EamA family transporter [Clostridiales bacterium]|nr:EamA family transporter [Clostridiales bacterium]
MSEKKYVFYIIAGASLWGLIGLFTRGLGAAGLDSMQITEIRCFMSAVLMICYFLVRDRGKLKISPGDIGYFLGTGICSMVFFNICYFITIKELTLSAAAMLLYTAPCMVMIMSVIFFGEKLTARKLAALFVAAGGCALTCISGEAVKITFKGVMLGLGSGLGYALYSIFSRAAIKKYDSLTITVYTFIVAAAALIPFSKPLSIGAALTDTKTLTYALLLSVISTMLPYILYTKGLERVEPGKASVMAFIEPMVATAAGIAVFGEKPTLMNMSGIALIFMSVVLLNLHPKLRFKDQI